MEARVLKKYWKLLVVSLVIIFAISGHYIYSAKALQSERVTFTIDPITGDESELDDLIVEVSSYDAYTSQWVYISKDGVRDVRNRYASNALFTSYEPLQFERYLTEYRSFMRGKQYDLNRYNEDGERLIYVKTSDLGRAIYKGEPIKFKVDVLQKETKKHTEFEATALAKSHYSWVNVVDVYAANGEVKVLVSGSFEDGGADLQLYTINEETQQVTASETLSEKVRKDRIFANVYYYGDTQSLANTAHYVFRESTWRYDEKKHEDEELTNDYFVYSVATKEIDALELPVKENIYTAFQQGDSFYLTVEGKDSLIVHRYYFEDKEWAEPLTIGLPLDVERMPYLQANGDKLYIANPEMRKNVLSIYDFSTAELLYKGEIIGENVGPYAEVLVGQIFMEN